MYGDIPIYCKDVQQVVSDFFGWIQRFFFPDSRVIIMWWSDSYCNLLFSHFTYCLFLYCLWEEDVQDFFLTPCTSLKQYLCFPPSLNRIQISFALHLKWPLTFSYFHLTNYKDPLMWFSSLVTYVSVIHSSNYVWHFDSIFPNGPLLLS